MYIWPCMETLSSTLVVHKTLQLQMKYSAPLHNSEPCSPLSPGLLTPQGTRAHPIAALPMVYKQKHLLSMTGTPWTKGVIAPSSTPTDVKESNKLCIPTDVKESLHITHWSSDVKESPKRIIYFY